VIGLKFDGDNRPRFRAYDCREGQAVEFPKIEILFSEACNLGREQYGLVTKHLFATELYPSASKTSQDSQEVLRQGLCHPRADRGLMPLRIKSLEELGHDPLFDEGIGSDLDNPFDGQMNALFGLFARILELEGRISLLAERIDSLEENSVRSYGKKTARRIERLNDLLKVYGGSQAFKQLRNDLDLSPPQFTRLVGCLDRRFYEIRPCPDAQKGEKMLILLRGIEAI
jgi:hypothetical protein